MISLIRKASDCYKNDIWEINFIKIFLIVNVIIIHANTPFRLLINENPLFFLFVQPAVPCFMVLSGFTMDRRMNEQKNPKMYYKAKILIRRVMRFAVPSVFAGMFYVLEMISLNMTDTLGMDLLKVQFGPGSYYILLSIEVLIVFPLINWLNSKNSSICLVICIILCLGLEAFATFGKIDPYIYSRSIIRFLPFLCGGCWISKSYNKEKRIDKIILLVLMLVGGS